MTPLRHFPSHDLSTCEVGAAIGCTISAKSIVVNITVLHNGEEHKNSVPLQEFLAASGLGYVLQVKPHIKKLWPATARRAARRTR